MFCNPLCEQMTRQTRPGLTVPKKMDTSGSSLLRVCFSCGAKISFTHWRCSLSSDHPCLDHLRLLWRRDVNPPSRISFTHVVYVKSLFFGLFAWISNGHSQVALITCPNITSVMQEWEGNIICLINPHWACVLWLIIASYFSIFLSNPPVVCLKVGKNTNTLFKHKNNILDLTTVMSTELVTSLIKTEPKLI